ncbi:MAG: sugar phosphate isomerase/epimerase [Chloroflexi bacterium]|nr:sugar phosphate isomerase/epimerase [Chloroflexota bacterium]
MTMRLGYSAWAMPQLPVAEQIALVRAAGYVGIELVSGPTSSLDAQHTDAGERRRIRARLADAELALPSIAGHGNLLEPDPEKRAAQLARVQAAVDLAADLAGPSGPPCVVTMAYGRPDRYEQLREAVAGNFAGLARYAGRRGVVVALEPHVGQAFDLPEKVLWLLERVGSPHFRLNLDNSHFEVMGCDLADYVPLLAPFSVHTHVKDQRGRAPSYEFLVPGEGDFDYARYLATMDRAGYRGFITVEISKQVQTRPDYDPAETAARSFETLTAAAARAGVALAHR